MDDTDFVVGNRPADLNIQESHGPPSGIKVTKVMDLKQDVHQLGLAGKVWESAYILQSYFSQEQPGLEPPCPIPDAYFASSSSSSSSSNENKKQHPPFRILELGAGVGYCGLSLANVLNASCQVYITDMAPVVPLMKENVAAHHQDDGAHASVVCTRLHWGNASDADALLRDGPFDLVVISDCVYYPELFAILMDTLLTVCAPHTQVVIGYKCRSLEKEAGFWDFHFGRYFDYDPVRCVDGSLFGNDQDCYVFVGQRRAQDQVLKTADDRFVLTMLNTMSCDIFD
ncbi:putative methyltransferase-domain-containing protein [Gongronella butleri]|nr:putative methyltransferase-domain-containing protein [Gongronella butleri]